MSPGEVRLALNELDKALRRALAVAGIEEVLRQVRVAVSSALIELDDGDRAEEERLARMDDLSAYLAAKYGPVPEELIAETLREWPNYEELAEDQRTALMDEYAAELEAANGPVSDEELREAQREWPDFEQDLRRHDTGGMPAALATRCARCRRSYRRRRL